MSDFSLSIFKLKGLSNVIAEADEIGIFLKGNLNPELTCPKCSKSHYHKKEKSHRFFLLPPVGDKQAKLQVTVQRQACVSCKHSWWPKAPFASGKQRMSKSFVSYALELLKFGSIKDVANHLQVGWDVIKGLHKRYLEKVYQEVDVSNVKYISIDEFAIAKNHKYMTIMVDIQTGRIIYAVEGRKKKEIKPILEDLKKKPLNFKQLQWI